jgi:hypothetical protein
VIAAALAGSSAQAQYTIRTFAGGGPPEGSQATAVGLHCDSIAVDTFGHLYVSGGVSNRIFKVSPEGVITTVAGNGVLGLAGDGGPATSAELSQPAGVILDKSGNLLIIDGDRIRKVSASGTITTLAGNGNFGFSGDGARDQRRA